MSDIFISYASEDKGRVQALARALEWTGWSVWWDRRIPIGRSYAEVIEEALDTSKAVVVVWTNASVKSQWVKNEALEGLKRQALFPVILEEVKIPLEFRHVQGARLMDWQPEQEHAGFDQFIDDLAGMIGVPVTQSQATPTSSAKRRPKPETGSLQGAVQAVLLSGNNNLAALTLSPGTLVPSFAASTTDYTVNVASDVTNVNVSATKADLNAVLSGNVIVGAGTATGRATLPLKGPGTVTPAVFTVTANNGSSRTYRIMVNRLALSGNNSLSALAISPGSLTPVFSEKTLSYTVDVASTVTSVTVTPTRQDPNAMITVDGTPATSDQGRSITLNGAGSNTLINIVVTAPNGSQKSYTITVERAALSGKNNLSGLTFSPGPLTPAFTAATTNYTVDVASTVTSITVTPTRQDPNATITLNGQPTNSGQARTVPLSGPGSNTLLTIVVTASNGTQKTYAVEVSRAVEVELEPERLEPTMASAVGWDSPRGSFSSQGETEFSGVSQESAQAGDDRPSESTRTGQSTESLPYLPIGLGLLATIGALVYFLVFSQGPSPGPRDVAPYQPAVQPPTTWTESITPIPVPEPIKQPAPVTPPEKPIVRQGVGQAKPITGKDGAPMVRIPAGEFQKGGGVKSDDRVGPMRHVVLDAFYMDKYEVTVGLYAKFLRDTGRSKPQLWDAAGIKKHQDRPVVNLNWYDAKSYCEWANKRLPTAAESEYASRGNDGRLYPWGNEDPYKGGLTNFARGGYEGSEDSKITENQIYSLGVATVGSYKRDKSPFGIYDMAGNAAEWVADWCCEKGQDDQQGAQRNPKGPSSGKAKLIRLGNWDTSNDPVSTFFGSRAPDEIFFGISGVRCAQDVPN